MRTFVRGLLHVALIAGVASEAAPSKPRGPGIAGAPPSERPSAVVVLCDRPELRAQAWQDASDLHVELVVRGPLANETDTSSCLMLHAGDGSAFVPRVDRLYYVNASPELPGFSYQIVLDALDLSFTGLYTDSAGRAAIERSTESPGGAAVRRDHYVIPLSELPRTACADLRLAAWVRCGMQQLDTTAAGEGDSATYAWEVPLSRYRPFRIKLPAPWPPSAHGS